MNKSAPFALSVFCALSCVLPAWAQSAEGGSPAPAAETGQDAAANPDTASEIPAEQANPEASDSPSVESTEGETETAGDEAPATNRFKVVDIEVEGSSFRDAVLLSMYIKPGDEVTLEQVRNDLRRIYGLGYFLDVTARRDPVPGGYRLVVIVQENPVLKEVRIVNDLEVFDKDEILKRFADQLGQTANFDSIRETEQAILQLYRDQGYVLANVRFLRTQLNDVEGLLSMDGILELRINEGRMEDLRISGNKETKDYVVLREITLKPGELFNSERFTADLRRIYNTNFFESVNFVPRPGEKDPNDWIIVVEVKERPTGQVNMGAGFNNRDGLVGTFQIIKDNLMGEGRRLAVDLQLGVDVFSIFNQTNNFVEAQRTLLGRIDFYDPWMFEGRTSFGTSVFSERIPLFFGTGVQDIFNLPAGSGIIQSRVGTSISFGRPLFGDLTSPWRGSLSARAEQVGVTDLARNPLRDLTVSNRFSATDVFFSVGGSISYDTRDVIMDPRSGWYGLLSVEPVWGDSAYLRLSGNMSTYLGLTDWLTLAIGGRGGTYLGQNPEYEQFYSNGFNVIRGWPENGFLFGKHFVIGSVELRFPIFNPVSGVVFTDIGEFLPVPEARVELNQGLPFKYGAGLGIRLNTPMGPLRLDYGVRDFSKLNFESLFDAGQLHFSIGQKF
ncbi:MAG: BamA/TamA family outer membrane protein [Candidatus Sericytochromatia bacterium]|nr:BamA/TamA family outer membrane protein [Candidatus Sericytochromatia bacterium]